jgi:hypothetical protein
MSDYDLGLANVQREIARRSTTQAATIEGPYTVPAGHIGNVFFWIDFGGKRKRLDFYRKELDESREAVSTDAAKKIEEAFRS